MAAPSTLFPALVAELAGAIEAVGGSPVPVSAGAGVTGPAWSVGLTATGLLKGTITLTADRAGVTALLHHVLGAEADTTDAAARDLLNELVAQGASGVCLKAPFEGLTLAVGAIEPVEATAPAGEPFALAVANAVLQLAVGAALEAGESPKPAKPAAPPARVAQPGGAGGGIAPGKLEVVLDIELPLTVRFGSTMMSIRSLSGLGPGSIVDMGRSPDDPVEILVCGRPIARAEVVVVGGNYGVRITDLISAAERLRAMEGQL